MINFILSDEVNNRKALSTVNAAVANSILIVVENIKTKVKQEYISSTIVGYALDVSKVSAS
jgi:hypothetical protein